MLAKLTISLDVHGLSLLTSLELLMMTSQMDKARKTKDKAYKNVFKGSVLISSLIEQDEKKFKDREAAVKVSTQASTQAAVKVSTQAAVKVSTQAAVKVSTQAAVKVSTQAAVKVSTQAAVKVSTQAAVKVSTQAAVKVSTQAHNHSYLAHGLIAVYKLYDVLKSTITISALTGWTKYGNEKITKIVFFLLFLIFEGTLKSDDVVTQSSNACVYVTRP